MSRSARNRKVVTLESAQATVESMTHDGRGVARIDGKAVFIEGALPGEEVRFTYTSQRKSFDETVVTEIVQPSSARVIPQCKHFGVCGGCSLQHMHSDAQLEMKQSLLLDTLQHLGKLQPVRVLPPLRGPVWGYRRKARLGAKYVLKKEALFIGFREKKSALLTDIARCEILHPSVGTLLPALHELLVGLSGYDRIPQIEVAVGDKATALVFRHLDPLSMADQDRLRNFGETHNMQIYLQSAGPESVALLWPETATLSYCLPNYDVELFFTPTDFVQINADINQRMVERVIDILDLQPQDQVLDLFCGLGNFTLPLARHAAQVTGIEGDARLVQRARDNAAHNNISNVDFYAADLNESFTNAIWSGQHFDKILLDPPRTGALEIVKQIALFGAARIVYVSCNPATLARDAQELVQQGYQLTSAGVMDMFPHTAHVESIACFEKLRN